MTDFDEPTNPLVSEALRDYAAERSEERRREVFEVLADAPLMIPAKSGGGALRYERLTPSDGESVEVIMATGSDGGAALCAFSNGGEFVAWAQQHPFLVLTGRELAGLALSNATGRIVLNASGGDLMFTAYADEIMALASGGMPDGVERPEAQLPPPASMPSDSTGAASPSDQLRIGPPPTELNESERSRVVAACQSAPGVTGALLVGLIVPGQTDPVRAVVLELDSEPDESTQQTVFGSIQAHLAEDGGEPIPLGFTVGIGPLLHAAEQINIRLF